jgi:demethylmenaquinone methyltransferase/2-methoxy-6-polyprenyl-1,4-benzoquinol methylase
MSSHTVSQDVLAEMAQYYRDRAPEYDEWFQRQGRYDQGEEANAAWFADVAEAFASFDALHFTGDVLELAPGTGIWTERLLRTVDTLTAIDIAPEMIAQNEAKVGKGRVRYLLADIFAWQPDRQYDGVCFCFWISHVPEEQLDGFLRTVAAALKPGGKLFFIDSHPRIKPAQPTAIQLPPEPGSQVLTRKLNDGRAYRIVKNFLEPRALEARCVAAGLDVQVHETPHAFIYGMGVRA